MPLHVFVIDSEVSSRRQLRQHLETMEQVVVAGEARDSAEAVPAAKKGIDVVVVEVPEGAREAQAIESIGQLLRAMPGVSVMASGPDASADLVIRAIRAGAVEFLRRPFSRDDVTAAIEKVRRLRRVPLSAEGAVGRVTSVYAIKGGLGVTTVATNLAVCLAQRAPDSVILLDLDLHQGGVTTLLNLRASYSILDAFGHTERLDEAFLRGLLVRHPSGLSVLPAPSMIERSRFAPQQIQDGLELIRAYFSHVVLDLPHDVDPGTIAALEESDQILYLVGLNVSALRVAAAGLAAFRHLGIDQRKVRVVVARADAREEVTLKQAREALGVPVFWRTPNDYPTVISASNEGKPLVLSSPRTEIAKSLRHLSEAISRGPSEKGEGLERSPSLMRRVLTSS